MMGMYIGRKLRGTILCSLMVCCVSRVTCACDCSSYCVGYADFPSTQCCVKRVSLWRGRWKNEM